MNRWLSSLLGICACLAAVPAWAQNPMFVKLVHVSTGKALSVADESDDDGAAITLAKESDSRAQQWQMQKDGDFYKVVNRKSGKVIDVYEDSFDEDTQIIQWEDKPDENDNQRWTWAGEGEERRLIAASSGLVLDIADDRNIVQRRLSRTARSQLWRVKAVKE